MKRHLADIARWFVNLDLLILLLILLIVASGWIVLAVIGHGSLQEFDTWVLRSLRNPDNLNAPIGPSWLRQTARDVTALGGYPLIVLLTLLVVIYLLLAKKPHAVFFVLAAIIGGWMLSTWLKTLFSRPRPDVVPHLTEVASASFPSGHSMLSAVVYLTLGSLLARLVEPWRLKVFFVSTALIIALLVGLTRVYLGVHFPSDVAAGWTLGLAWAIFCWLIARELQRKHMVEEPIPDQRRHQG